MVAPRRTAHFSGLRGNRRHTPRVATPREGTRRTGIRRRRVSRDRIKVAVDMAHLSFQTACKSLNPLKSSVFLQFSACALALKVCPPHVMTSNPASPQAMLSSPRCPRDAVPSPQARIRSARPRSTRVARFTVVANMSTRADVSDEMDGCPARRHYERWIQVRSWCEL